MQSLIDCENSRRRFVRSELDLAAWRLLRNFSAAVRCPRGQRRRLRFRPTFIRGVPIGSAVGLFGDSGRFASGMAARKGEDPLAGLQRSQQPGPPGDGRILRSQRRTTADIFSETDR